MDLKKTQRYNKNQNRLDYSHKKVMEAKMAMFVTVIVVREVTVVMVVTVVIGVMVVTVVIGVMVVTVVIGVMVVMEVMEVMVVMVVIGVMVVMEVMEVMVVTVVTVVIGVTTINVRAIKHIEHVAVKIFLMQMCVFMTLTALAKLKVVITVTIQNLFYQLHVLFAL
jgi:hypothetical protein